MRILMVCLGNICRSPVAAGVMQHLADTAETGWQVDSAGTASWHRGGSADPRAIAIAERHGVDISGHRARPFSTADFDQFERIYAMDRDNLRNLRALAPDPAAAAKVALLDHPNEIQDPYYDDRLFAPVYQQIARACARRLTEAES